MIKAIPQKKKITRSTSSNFLNIFFLKKNKINQDIKCNMIVKIYITTDNK